MTEDYLLSSILAKEALVIEKKIKEGDDINIKFYSPQTKKFVNESTFERWFQRNKNEEEVVIYLRWVDGNKNLCLIFICK